MLTFRDGLGKSLNIISFDEQSMPLFHFELFQLQFTVYFFIVTKQMFRIHVSIFN
jgi:hypothetical protein